MNSKKFINTLLIALITLGITAASGAMIKVNVLEERVNNYINIIKEIKIDVKWIRKQLLTSKNK